VATAAVAAIGNGAAFHKGREFAAWLGLIPKQYSTGGKTKLLGISKRGNPYLRKMFLCRPSGKACVNCLGRHGRSAIRFAAPLGCSQTQKWANLGTARPLAGETLAAPGLFATVVGC